MFQAKYNPVEGWRMPVKQMYFPEPVNISHDVMIYDESCKYNILCIVESEAVTPNYNINDINRFDLVLTWRESLLEQCPKAVKFLYGTTWVEPVEDVSIKQDKISFLISSLNYTNGHIFRQDLMRIISGMDELNGLKLDCYTSPPLIESKNTILDEYKFSIVVENDRKRNYFTEKIMDCFVTKTVPIYWGCPNIDEYFDESAIIRFDSIVEFFSAVDSLDKNTYDKMLSGVEKNFELAKKYFLYFDRVEEAINETFWSKVD